MLLVIYTTRAQKDLSILDKSIAKRIVRKVEEYSMSSEPLAQAKALTGVLSGKYRYRIGDYRAIFMVDSEGLVTILSIITIKHRKDIYR